MNTITLVLTLSLNVTNQYGGIDTHNASNTMSNWKTIESCEEAKADLVARTPEAFTKYISPEFIYTVDMKDLVISANCIQK
jgi:hypothetical protein